MEYIQNFSNDSRYKLKLNITETINQSTNTSTLAYTISVTKSSGSGYYDLHSDAAHFYLKIDNLTITDVYAPYDFRNATPKTIDFVTASTVVAHNNDGTKTIQVQCFGDLTSTTRGTSTINETIVLTPIERPSIITGIDAQTIGHLSTLSVTSFVTGATNSVSASVGGTSIAVTKINDNSFTLTVPFNLMSTTSKDLSVTFVTTSLFEGITHTISQQYTYSALDNEISPQVLTTAVTPDGSDQWFAVITRAKIQFSLSSLNSRYGATVNRYEVLLSENVIAQGNLDQTSPLSYTVYTSYFANIGVYDIKVRVYDTRNVYEQFSQQVTIVPYTQPRQSSFGGGNYRLFFASSIYQANIAITDASLRVLNCTIKEDVLNKATSQFEVLGIPNAMQNGDYIGCYDSYKGRFIYSGIVTNIDNNTNTITTQQLVTFFDTNFIMKEYAIYYYEFRIAVALDGAFLSARGMNNSYSYMYINWQNNTSRTQTPATLYKGPYNDKFTIGNPYTLMKEWYNSFGIIDLAELSINNGKLVPTNYAFNPATYYTKLTLTDNTSTLRNFNIVKNNGDYNSVIIWNKNTTINPSNIIANRCFFVDDDYVVKRNDRATNVPHRLKQKFVLVNPSEYDLSDQDVVDSLGRQNLNVEQYNHKIEFDLALNNKLFDFFEDFKLGRPIDLYIGDKYYSSVITGYTLETDNEGEFTQAHIICGKARLNLEVVLSNNGIRN